MRLPNLKINRKNKLKKTLEFQQQILKEQNNKNVQFQQDNNR